MGPCHEKVKGERGERREHGLHKRFAPSAMILRGSVDAMQQLRSCDRGDSNVLTLA